MADAVEKRRRLPAYRGRFLLAYALVLALFGGVIVLFAFLVSQNEGPRWAVYEPRGDGIDRAQNIANHVGNKYREGAGAIAAIDAQPPIVGSTLVDAIAIQRAASSGVGGGYEQVDTAEGTIVYVFCGTGQRCAIPGTPTYERGQLLRRESLELALYTFKYMGDVKSVVTLLPPTGRQNTAVYLKRSAVRDLLDRPLYKTLPARGPFQTGELPDAEASERLTVERFFTSEFQELPNGRGLLVLTRPSVQ
jgi:hypothetical protein